MGLKVTTAPTWEPVTLAEAKANLRVDFADDDAQITAMIAAARESVEHLLQRSIPQKTFTLALDRFPCESSIILERGPVQSIASVQYVDINGTTQTWAAGNYVLDNNGLVQSMRLAYNATWPTTRDQPNAVTVVYVAGYASASLVEEAIKRRILLEVGTLYEYRKSASDRLAYPSPYLSPFADRLAQEHRIWNV